MCSGLAAVLAAACFLFAESTQSLPARQAGTGRIDRQTAVRQAQRPLTVVPSVLGKTLDGAREILAGSNLRLGNVTEMPADPDRSPGSVFRQSLPSGSRVPFGTAVDVVVASQQVPVVPPRPTDNVRPTDDMSQRMTTVPGLVGQTVEQARETLRQRDLLLESVAVSGEVRRRPGVEAEMEVVAQDPQADARVPRGAGVRIVVTAKVPPPIEVPDLIGHSEAEARRLLETRSLVVGDVTRRADRGPQGTVVDQQPPAGTTLPPGSPVNVVLADLQVARVPDLAAQSLDEARRLCEQAGLRLNTPIAQPSTRTEGTILTQEPLAGQLVPVGSVVTVTVAAPPAVSGGPPARGSPPPPENEPPPPFPWVPAGVVSLIVALAGFQTLRHRIRRRQRPASSLEALRVEPARREMTSVVESDGNRITVEVRLRATRGKVECVAEPVGAWIIEESRVGTA